MFVLPRLGGSLAPRVSMVSEEKRKASRPTSVCQVFGQGTVFCRKSSRRKASRAERTRAIAADEPDSSSASKGSTVGEEGAAAGAGAAAGQELCLVRRSGNSCSKQVKKIDNSSLSSAAILTPMSCFPVEWRCCIFGKWCPWLDHRFW